MTLPGVAGGVTAADCEAGSAAAGVGVMVPRSGGGSWDGEVAPPSPAGGVAAADCEADDAAAGSSNGGRSCDGAVTLPPATAARAAGT